MTRLQYILLYISLLICSLVLIETAWIGAKYLIEGGVVHTWLDHFIALCGAFYVARDCMQVRLRLVDKQSRRRQGQ